MKFFNTVGVIDPERHYFLPRRLDWEQLTEFIERQYYFILHAPRQSGKTTSIIEFVKHLNEAGKYSALYLSTEPAHYSINNVKLAIKAILGQIKEQILIFLPDEKEAIEYAAKLLSKSDVDEGGVYDFICFWSKQSSKPLVIFLDEFDGLMGDSLIALLKQFRTGYTNRPAHFPQTICLIGVRDLRDYKVRTKQQEELGVLYSPFNIKAESIVLPNFSCDDVKTLYLQHTQETGQQFTDEAIEYAFYLTQGQPWLVNALAYQACFRDVKDRSQTITKEVIDRAKEALIARRDTHIDALIDRLQEPRVRNIMDEIINSTAQLQVFNDDDVQYVRDLGLIGQKNYAIANPIYQEIIPRALTITTQQSIEQESLWYINHDGSLDMIKLMQAFTDFFRKNSEMWLERFHYKEAGPHLLMMAFLQRVINGGGKIHREYALGRGRSDLLVEWGKQRIVIELKVFYNKQTLPEGLMQTAQYMKTSGATEGHLVIFDHKSKKSWDEKIYHKVESVDAKTVHVWGM
jgi:hypothetical protein